MSNLDHLSAEAAQVVEAARSAGRPAVYEIDIAEARANLVTAMQGHPALPIGSVTDSAAQLADRSIPVRIYRPETAVSGPHPALVYLHGGCWVIGDLDTHDADCRSLSTRSGCTVISVDYRLAPEHPFPAGLNDSVDVVRWICDHTQELDIRADRLFVAGVSAGGNLAAAVALAARDTGGPRLVGQVLIYPITDSDLSRSSYVRYGENHLLTTATMRWAWSVYAPNDLTNSLACPMRAEDHRGLPPAYILAAECDPLYDEGCEYAEHLRASGVPVVLDVVPGQVHAFFSSPGRSAAADSAHGRVAAWMRAVLSDADSATDYC